MLGALTDFLLVRIPKTMASGQYAGQEGSPLMNWFKQYDTRSGHTEGRFANWAQKLEETCKTPYDRQAAVLDGELGHISAMTGRSHRFQSLGHDPILGFVFGVLDILRGTVTGLSYDHLTGAHRIIEIVLRAYIMLRHYSEQAEVKLNAAQTPKYRSMLLAAHGVAAAANAGKVALYQDNPPAINQAEWMAFLRYLFPHMKYWMFDRKRLKREHIAQINEAGWDELASSAWRRRAGGSSTVSPSIW